MEKRKRENGCGRFVENNKGSSSDRNCSLLAGILETRKKPSGMCKQRIAFIGCSKRKKNFPCTAKELYEGVLFKKSLRYCLEHFDKVYILSAKYGLLCLTDKVTFYDKSLNSMSSFERKKWSVMVKSQIKRKGVKGEFWFFCGKNYCSFFKGQKPFEKMSLGYQLAWFKKHQRGLL